jgi:hypothetical protein
MQIAHHPFRTQESDYLLISFRYPGCAAHNILHMRFRRHIIIIGYPREVRQIAKKLASRAFYVWKESYIIWFCESNFCNNRLLLQLMSLCAQMRRG